MVWEIMVESSVIPKCQPGALKSPERHELDLVPLEKGGYSRVSIKQIHISIATIIVGCRPLAGPPGRSGAGDVIIARAPPASLPYHRLSQLHRFSLHCTSSLCPPPLLNLSHRLCLTRLTVDQALVFSIL